MTTEADIRRVNELYRRDRNKAAVDSVCKWFGIAVVVSFWTLLVSLCIVEWTR